MVLSTRQSVMSAVGLAELEGVNPVPTIQNQETALTLPEVITRHMPTEPALLSDFYGWGVGYYVAILSQLHRDQTLFVGPNRDIDLQRASAFLSRYRVADAQARASNRRARESRLKNDRSPHTTE